MAIYLPRGGDYERALKYIGSSRAIEGALEGAAAGLGLVSKMQGIADNAMSMEMKLENFRTKEAERTATALGALDALGGFGGGDDGDSKGGGRGGRSGKQRGGGGGGGREGMTDADKAQIAEVMNTLAQYEEAKALAGGGEAAPVELPGLEAEAVGPTGQPGEGTERTLDELVQGLPMEQDAEGVWSMRGDEVPSFTTGGGVDTSGRPWVSGISEGQRERLGRYAAEGRESDLDKAIRRYGLEDEPLAKPFTGGAPAPTPRGARMGIDERGAAADFLDRPTDALGEGLINPAVAMGFSGRTVLDPISQAYLYDLHRRGSALPTSVANILNVDRDKMFEPGSVKKSAEYQSQLTQALKRFEANDFAALERVTLQRLISGGLEGLDEDQMQSLAKDLSELSEQERNKAIEDLLSLPVHERASALARIRRVRITTGTQDPLATLKLLDKHASRVGSQRIRALTKYNDAKAEFDSKLADEKTKKAATGLKELKDIYEGLNTEYENTQRDRTAVWNKIRKAQGLQPVEEAPPEDEVGRPKTIDSAKDEATWFKENNYDRARVVDAIAKGKKAGLVYAEGVEDAILAEFPEVVVKPTATTEQLIKNEEETIKLSPGTSVSARNTRKEAASRIEKLKASKRREKLTAEGAGKAFDDFTEAANAAEDIARAKDVDRADAAAALETIESAIRSLRDIDEDWYWDHTGRLLSDDLGELNASKIDVVRIYNRTGGTPYRARRGVVPAPTAPSGSPGRRQ